MAAPTKKFVDNQPPQCDAKDLNAYLNEINNAIRGAGLNLNDEKLTQLQEAVCIQGMAATVFAVSGTANAIELNPKGGKMTVSSYYDGLRVLFYAQSPNTSNVTISVAGIGPVAVKTPDDLELVGGMIDGFVEVVYDESRSCFVLALQSGSGGADGPPGNKLFYPSDQSLTDDFSLAYDKNWMMAGPLIVDAGKTLTVESGARLVVV